MADRTSENAWILRLGSAAGVLGSLLAMVGNLLHPATPTGDPEGVARSIAESGAWVAVHLLIIVGLIMMLGGLGAIALWIDGGLPGALARMGLVTAIAGVTVGLVLVIVDGVAAKHLADAWAAAPAEEKAAALRVVVGEETINFALASLFNILFAGVAFMLYGVAVASSGVHARWAAWLVAVAGAWSIPVGVVQAYVGESTTFTRVATIISPTIITLWVAWVSWSIWRMTGWERSRQPAPSA
ncbi:MAG TPA: hypothetical protein VHI54_08460 [Actinomycetota bacterium]|nr:hypothetical protein [Actinomycetota bacterium]